MHSKELGKKLYYRLECTQKEGALVRERGYHVTRTTTSRSCKFPAKFFDYKKDNSDIHLTSSLPFI